MSNAKLPDPRFILLDGLRGIAALAVVLYHADPAYLPGAHLAVDFFFCLSGFVIALNYREKLRQGELGFGRFIALRLVRLYPMLLLGGVLGMVLLNAGPQILLLVPDVNGRALFPGNPPFWSLLAEWAAYVVFAVVLVRLGWRWVLLIALLAGAALVVLTATDPDTVTYGLGKLGAFWQWVWPGVFRALAGFTLGTLLYALWLRVGSPRSVGWSALLTPVALVAVMAFAPANRTWWDLAGALVLLPAITLAGACRELPWTRINVWLGDLSYPIYCIHAPILVVVGRREGPELLVAAALVPVALLLDRIYDRPARKALGRLLSR